MMNRLMLLIGLVIAGSAVFPMRAQQTQACTPAGSLVALPGVKEASGLAVSRRTPGRLWTHNDSGSPLLFALDSRGAVTGQVRITGASVTDWEAVAVGPCGNGSCIYIGDIGDNEAGRRNITVYRLPEPDAGATTVAVTDVLHATYPDGAHDAETLLVADGRLYIVTKGETGPMSVYRFPADVPAGGSARLERVGESQKATDDLQITDGSVSQDGQMVVLRSRTGLIFYRSADLLAGRWRAVTRVDLRTIKEPQGEGVAFGADRALFLAGEGGGKAQGGTFARLSCSTPLG